MGSLFVPVWFIVCFSVHHVLVPRPDDGEAGDQGVAQGRRRHQVRHPADSVSIRALIIFLRDLVHFFR